MDWMTFLNPPSPHSHPDSLAFFALPRLRHPRLLPSWVGVSAPSRVGFRECSGEGRAVAASQVALSPNLAPSCANEAGLFAFHANEQIPEEVPFSPGGSLCSHSSLRPAPVLNSQRSSGRGDYLLQYALRVWHLFPSGQSAVRRGGLPFPDKIRERGPTLITPHP